MRSRARCAMNDDGADQDRKAKCRRTCSRGDLLRRYLDTAGIPDPDLLIRTSGEIRLSNYLLWQLAYSEIYITDCLWPDFNRDELIKAIEQFNQRDRRFGGVKA